MGRLNAVMAAAGVAALAFFTGPEADHYPGPAPVYYRHVSENLESIIGDLEEEFGIEFDSEPEWRISSDPNEGTPGEYFPSTDLIVLYSSNIDFPGEDEFSLNSDIERVLRHELGHFYLDNRSEELGLGDFPQYDESNYKFSEYIQDLKREGRDKYFNLLNMLPDIPPREFYRSWEDEFAGIMIDKMISEGVAEYFEDPEKDSDFGVGDYPESVFYEGVGSHMNWIKYEGGLDLVKPIIEGYEKEGIDYLLLHPPRTIRLSSLPLWQFEVLGEIRPLDMYKPRDRITFR